MGFSHLTPPDAQSPSHDFESDAFFFNTYVPLSSLPTPPPSCHSRSGSNQLTPEALLTSPLLKQTLLGPSIHLTRLIPAAASLLDPCNEIVHDILVRARCPMPVLSLACGILDSLNSKFSLAWRRSLPLERPCYEKDDGIAESAIRQQHAQAQIPSNATHIDEIRPELILLSSLIIATKFLNDEQTSTQYYAQAWAQARWSCRMINVTEQCIMANLQYRLLHLANNEALKEAEEDMARTGYFARRNSGVPCVEDDEIFSSNMIVSKEEQSDQGWRRSNKRFIDRSLQHGGIGLGIRGY